MEEQKVIRALNGWYYGIMVFTLIVLGGMYYLTSQPDFEPMDTMSQVGMILQYAAIFTTLIAIPLGLYLIKWFGGYRSMMWIAAISAIAWYFSKPTLGKLEQEMTPHDPNEETY